MDAKADGQADDSEARPPPGNARRCGMRPKSGRSRSRHGSRRAHAGQKKVGSPTGRRRRASGPDAGRRPAGALGGPVEADYGDFNRPDPLERTASWTPPPFCWPPGPDVLPTTGGPRPERRARKKNKSAAGPAAEPQSAPRRGPGHGGRRQERRPRTVQG
jgi:hypothetical protein